MAFLPCPSLPKFPRHGRQTFPVCRSSSVPTAQATIDQIFNMLYTPIQTSLPLLAIPWHRRGGNYVLYPPSSKPAKAVLHFLGGAFIGAAPHIAYDSFLRSLSHRGYVIVATPYDLSFDYLQLTSSISEKWEAVESDLAAELGPLPVIGVGHSAGALFHAIGSTLFDEAVPKAANVFISFNNKPAEEAVPMYRQLIAPSAKSFTQLVNGLPPDVKNGIDEWNNRLIKNINENRLTPERFLKEVIPVVKDTKRVIQQVWPLLTEVAGEEGSTNPPEFYPGPEDVKDAVEKMYPVEDNLVIEFKNDQIDQSQVIENAIRNKGNDVVRVEIDGNHLTPLWQDVPDLEKAAQTVGFGAVGAAMVMTGIEAFSRGLGGKERMGLEVILDEWIQAGIQAEKF